MLTKRMRFAAVFGALVSLCAPAGAGAEWRFVPENCPAGPLPDPAAESVRPDGPVIVCPLAAWVWGGEGRPSTPAPDPAVVYYHPEERYYYRHGVDGAHIRLPAPEHRTHTAHH